MKPRDWPKVEELYHAALEKPPAEREAFLDQACAGDDELGREVLSLLAQEKDAERLMERPAASAATQKLAVARGTRLGPYEVVELVGAGGMGEVYRARDTRLGRDVAIKVLPEQVAHDPEALRRFDREARAVAALSHPHIEALHDIGETDGTHYLVMELLEGETLATRLRRGALPEREALRIGAEIAEALGVAHGHGIVHRDVKPANVMLTRSGAKLLDFGLARLQRRLRPGPSGETASTTTELGERGIAGTLPYMAPEQLEGREADARTDIWALGCVLFEMLSGKRAFESDSQARLVAAIEKDETPSLRPAATSPAVERLVRQCLEKDREERWQSAGDLARRLREIAEVNPEVEVGLPARRRWRFLAPVVAGACGLGLLAGLLAGRLWLSPAAAPPVGPVVRSSVDMPANLRLSGPQWVGAARTELALSPDGTILVWTGAPMGEVGWMGWPDTSARGEILYRRRLDTAETTPIAGTEGGMQPFFSPDGRWLGFWSRGKLRKIPVDGGTPVDLADAPGQPPMGSVWAPDGRIILGSPGASGGLSWVPADGGACQPLTKVEPHREASHRLPWMLPGGNALLFTAMPQAFAVRARVEALTLARGARKVLLDDAADARYLPSGHLVFARQAVLMAAPFDPARLELTGPAVPVLEGVAQALNTGIAVMNSGSAQFAVSPTGLLAYASGGIVQDGPEEIVLVDRSGRATPVPGFDRPLVTGGQARFSPDGRSIAFVEKAISGRLWLFDVERKTHRALSQDGLAGFPLWSPDGTRLVVRWSVAGPISLWSVPVEGGGAWERLTDAHDVPSSFSPDGRTLAFIRVSAGGRDDILLYRFADRQVVPFIATDANESAAAFSPDGRWLAYVSDESGRAEVYVTSFPDRRRTLVVSTRGGMDPAWSRDGTELFYRVYGAEGALMNVRVTHGETITLGPPTKLFPSASFDAYAFAFSYDLAPNGRRFLFGRDRPGVTPVPPAPITRLNLVHNWFADLERLCPTRR